MSIDKLFILEVFMKKRIVGFTISAVAVGIVADYAVQSGWLTAEVAVKVLFLVQHVAVDGLLLCCGSAFTVGRGFFLAAASCQRKHHRACQQNRQDSFDFHDNFSFRAYQTLLFYTASSLKPCN